MSDEDEKKMRQRTRLQEDVLMAQFLIEPTRPGRTWNAALPVGLGCSLAVALVLRLLPAPIELPPYLLVPTYTVRTLGGSDREQHELIRLGKQNMLKFKVVPERPLQAPVVPRCYVKRSGERVRPLPIGFVSERIKGKEVGTFSFSKRLEELPIINEWDVGTSFQLAVVLAPEGEHPSLAVVDGVLSGVAKPRSGWQIVSRGYEIMSPNVGGSGRDRGGAVEGPAADPREP